MSLKLRVSTSQSGSLPCALFARGRVGVGAVILFQLAPMAQGHPVPTFPRALCAQGKGLDWRAFAARCNPSVVERREETLNPP